MTSFAFIGKLRNKHKVFLPMTIIAFLYVSLYFICSEVFCVTWKGDPMKFRIFNHNYQTVLWRPLIALEELLTDIDFYSHVKNGASLPYEEYEKVLVFGDNKLAVVLDPNTRGLNNFILLGADRHRTPIKDTPITIVRSDDPFSITNLSRADSDRPTYWPAVLNKTQ